MPHLRFLRCSSRLWHRLTCLASLWVGCTLLLSGCLKCAPSERAPLAAVPQTSRSDGDSWALAPHAEQLPLADQASATVDIDKVNAVQNSQFWAFSADTRLICLPSVDHTELPVAQIADISETPEPLGQLMPPEECQCDLAPNEIAVVEEPIPLDDLPPVIQEPPIADVADQQVARPNRAIETPVYDGLSAEEQRLLEVIRSETLGATTGALTDARLDQECRAAIAAAYALSQRGAVYAARQQLIGVLREISQAKDSRDGTRSRTESLAAGLRALEEAEDFAPRGSQLEGEMKLEIICAAHRTPQARELNLAEMLPAQMTERYNRYAQIKLAVAVAGEPAGSTALYALGKLNSQLAATEPEQNPLATRRAVAFQQAALLAHNENYLAAHELGVLLAETGHYPEARHLLLQVAVEQPNAVVFRNLASVQDALGNHAEAQLCRTEAEQLAQRGRGPKPNVAWVPPQEFSRNQINTFTPHMASNPSAPAVAWR